MACPWSCACDPPPPLIKVASNTRPYSKLGGTTLNGREEEGQYYISQTCDQERFEARKVVFSWECLNISATGYSKPPESWSLNWFMVSHERVKWMVNGITELRVPILASLNFFRRFLITAWWSPFHGSLTWDFTWVYIHLCGYSLLIITSFAFLAIRSFS